MEPLHDFPDALNATYPLDDNDPLFYVCWRRQACGYCLQGDVPCSWCPVSSTCVPNRSHLPILAPLGSAKMCPLGPKERWELRSVSFGCNVSTTTFLTAVVSVLATLAAVAMGWFVVWALPRVKAWWKQDGKYQVGCFEWVFGARNAVLQHRGVESGGGDIERSGGDEDDLERRPLLGG